MKRWIVAICVLVFLPSCGVNPERAKNLRIAEESSAGELKKDAEDSPSISNAIDTIGTLNDAIASLDFSAIEEARTSILETLRFNADEATLTNSKTPLILEKLNEADRHLAEKLGEKGAPLLDPNREYSVEASAISQFGTGIELCKTIASTSTKEELAELSNSIESAFQKANMIDANIERYNGKNTAGAIVDHPFSKTLCDHNLAQRKIQIGDAEPIFADRSSDYLGCGKFELGIQAKQEEKEKFGPYLLVNKAAFADAAPSPERVECATIPPLSDAPQDVLSLVKSNVQWLKETDILSMKGEFKYQESDSGMLKEGRVFVFRRDAALKTNICGAKDSLVVCSAQGNAVTRAFDLGMHYLNRSNVYRAHGDAAQCKEMAMKAVEFTSKKLEYDGKLLYQTNNDKRLQPSEIKAKLEAMKTEASTMSNSDWCQPNSNTK